MFVRCHTLWCNISKKINICSSHSLARTQNNQNVFHLNLIQWCLKTNEFGLRPPGDDHITVLFPKFAIQVGHSFSSLDCFRIDDDCFAFRRTIQVAEIYDQRCQLSAVPMCTLETLPDMQIDCNTRMTVVPCQHSIRCEIIDHCCCESAMKSSSTIQILRSHNEFGRASTIASASYYNLKKDRL